jgi:oligopeptide transport system ATP-binding protein
VVRHVADRVAVMYLGRIAEIGDTAAIYDEPANPYTQALLSAVPSPDRAARGRLAHRRVLAGEPPSPVDPPTGCRFHPRCWLATDRCARDTPPLLEIGTGTRRAACHFAEEAMRRAGDL